MNYLRSQNKDKQNKTEQSEQSAQQAVFFFIHNYSSILFESLTPQGLKFKEHFVIDQAMIKTTTHVIMSQPKCQKKHSQQWPAIPVIKGWPLRVIMIKAWTTYAFSTRSRRAKSQPTTGETTDFRRKPRKHKNVSTQPVMTAHLYRVIL